MKKLAFPFLITSLFLFSLGLTPLLLLAGYYQPMVGLALIITYGGRYSGAFLNHLQFNKPVPLYPVKALTVGVGLTILGFIV